MHEEMALFFLYPSPNYLLEAASQLSVASWGLQPRVWPSLTHSTNSKLNVPPGGPGGFPESPVLQGNFSTNVYEMHAFYSSAIHISEESNWWYFSLCICTITTTTCTTNTDNNKPKQKRHWAALLIDNSNAKILGDIEMSVMAKPGQLVSGT